MSIVAKGIKSMFQGLGSLLSPKAPSAPKAPPPPPTTPTRADAATTPQNQTSNVGLASLISSGPTGLQKKANTSKKSLLGGGT